MKEEERNKITYLLLFCIVAFFAIGFFAGWTSTKPEPEACVNLPTEQVEHCAYHIWRNDSALNFIHPLFSEDCEHIANNCDYLNGWLEVNSDYKEDYPNASRYFSMISGSDKRVVECNIQIKNASSRKNK